MYTYSAAMAPADGPTMEGPELDSITAIGDLATLDAVTQQDMPSTQCIQNITSLRVQNAGAQLALVHPSIGHLTSLVSLDMSGSTVHYLPYFISNLQKLQSLSFGRCQLNFIPAEIGELHSLTSLDLSRNQLQSIPNAVCQLRSLRTMNLMCNELTQLPADFGNLTGLRLLGLKSNKLAALPDSFTRLQSLVELFITDNKLVTLPTGFGSLTSLVKLQASFNSLTHLPPDLLQLPRLELMRVAVCAMDSLPSQLFDPESNALPSLAWFSLSGNGACAPVPPARSLPTYPLSSFEGGRFLDQLGDGASGEVWRAVLSDTRETVAIKIFRADVSPDGRTEEEIAIGCAVDHPHITRVTGIIPPAQQTDTADSSTGGTGGIKRSSAYPMLMMPLVHGRPLANKPTSEHLLRCKWPADLRFTLSQCVTMTLGVASALEYLHSVNICHGDVYAHNIMVNTDTWHSTLCDFGASFVYHPSQRFWEYMEVRGFALYLKDVTDRLVDAPEQPAAALRALVDRCTAAPAHKRPTFADIRQTLADLTAA